MKSLTHLLVSFVATVAIAVAASMSVPAVTHAQTQMGMKIPFDFYVGSEKFEPGNYIVTVNGAYIKISDGNGHSKFVLTNAVANPAWKGMGGGALIFTHYDNYYFLSEVRRGGYSTANGLTMAPLEVQVAKISATREKIAFQSGH